MSSEAKKSGRFGMLKGVREAAMPLQPEAVAAPPAVFQPDDTSQGPFSTTLSHGMRRRLKKASADEGRKQYLIVQQALEEYLTAHHPGLK